MNTNNQTSPTKEQVVNNFLHILRLSGITNMYGAGPYLQEAFGFTKYDANRELSNWMLRQRTQGDPKWKQND